MAFFVEFLKEIIMQKSESSDRRIFERMPVNLSLRFLDLRSYKEHLVQTHDVSAEGIGIVTSEAIPRYTPLEIWLQIPDKGEPLYTRGEVVWSKMIEPDRYRMGVSLEKADLMGVSRVFRIK